ncbi:MAG: hypothetical protein EBX59_01440 [Betaproteobacteria bacterium]|nr:hypothetical protein [Betaproteobacteria bacterium]
MAGTPITDLPEITSTTSADVFPIVQGGTTYQVQLANLTGLTQYAGITNSTGSALIGYSATASYPQATIGIAMPFYNVKASPFNAVGNGVANDTTAIQAAITALSGTGGIVYLPKGTYITTAPLVMAAGVSLVGEGMDVTIISYTGASDGIQSTAVKVGLYNFKMSGSAASVTGISFNGASYSNIKNVRLTGFETGYAATSCWGNVLEQVYAESCDQDGFWFANNANNHTLISCEGVSNGRAGLYAFGSRQLACYSCAFETNVYGVVVTNGASGVNAKSTLLSNCYIEGNTTAEVLIDDAGGGGPVPRAVSIKDTYFAHITGKAATAIRVNDVDFVEIDGCNFDDEDSAYTNSIVLDGGGTISRVVIGENKDTSASGLQSNSNAYQSNSQATAKAWGRFTVSGGAIATTNLYNIASVTYIGTGVYEVTLRSAMSGTNYGIVANAENGSSVVALLCSPGVPSSTTVFRIYTASNASTSAEARTVSFWVFA